jgi:hypothetical protein
MLYVCVQKFDATGNFEKKIGKFWELNKAFVPLRICKSILPNSLIKIRSKAISYNTIFSIHNFFIFIIAQIVLNLKQLYYKTTLQSAKLF